MDVSGFTALSSKIGSDELVELIQVCCLASGVRVSAFGFRLKVFGFKFSAFTFGFQVRPSGGAALTAGPAQSPHTDARAWCASRSSSPSTTPQSASRSPPPASTFLATDRGLPVRSTFSGPDRRVEHDVGGGAVCVEDRAHRCCALPQNHHLAAPPHPAPPSSTSHPL
eukprot:979278-Rhodomonas_salina.1